jgi:hypothetical protein
MCGTRKSPKTFGYELGLSLCSKFGGGFFDLIYSSPIISAPSKRWLFLVLSNRCNGCADARNSHAQKQLFRISGEQYPASSAYLTSSRARESPVIRRRFLRSEGVFAATLPVAQSDLNVLSFQVDEFPSFQVDEFLSFHVDALLSFYAFLCRQISPPAS